MSVTTDAFGLISKAVFAGTARIAPPGDVGAAWDEFFATVVAPWIDVVVAGAVIWLLLVVVARLLVLTPLLRRVKVSRWLSRVGILLGAALTAVGAVTFVVESVADQPFESPAGAVLVVSVSIAGIASFAFGMATRPRLDAFVTAASGQRNNALTTELLWRMRRMNADDTRGQVGRPSGSDLNEVIAVAEKTENWAVKLISGAISILLNLTPWRLEVTIFDAKSGLAVLHRNGKQIEEARLRLPIDAQDPKHPAELLALAAAFGTVVVAGYYPDIVGFYGARKWRGLGMLAVADWTDGRAGRAYLNEAIEEEPQSILVKHAEIYRAFHERPDRTDLEKLMDDLEPVIRRAAALCKVRRPEFASSEPTSSRHAAGRREPRLLMLRLITLYTTIVRNWSVLVPSSEWADALVGERRRRAEEIVGVFVDILPKTPRRQSKAAQDDLHRMKQRAALCYALLCDRQLASHGASAGGSRSNSARALRKRSEWVQQQLQEVGKSADFEVRYTYACYLARRRFLGDERSESEPGAIAKCLKLVCEVDEYYRDGAMDDPELRLLGECQELREAVLQSTSDAWEIQRFAEHRQALNSIGVLEPAWLSFESITATTLEGAKIDQRTAMSLIDGSRILTAAMGSQNDQIDEAARLRATRLLLDAQGHSAATLLAAYSTSAGSVVEALGKSMFWVPTDNELDAVRRFVASLTTRIAAPRMTA